MIMAMICLVNTTLFYLNIDLPTLSYIGGVSMLTLFFLYLSSYVFKFCEYHRMFLHYIVTVNVISYIDMEYGIPLSDFNLWVLYTSIAVLFMFLIIYLKFKHEHIFKEKYS